MLNVAVCCHCRNTVFIRITISSFNSFRDDENRNLATNWQKREILDWWWARIILKKIPNCFLYGLHVMIYQIKSNQIKFIKQQIAWRLLQVAKAFNTHKTNKCYMHTLLITRDVVFLYIYVLKQRHYLQYVCLVNSVLHVPCVLFAVFCCFICIGCYVSVYGVLRVRF